METTGGEFFKLKDCVKVDDQPKQNTDRELWRSDKTNPHAGIHVTENDDITICVGGTCRTMTVQEWRDSVPKSYHESQLAAERESHERTRRERDEALAKSVTDEITELRRQLAEAKQSRGIVKQPFGSRLCGAAVAAMATNQPLEHVVSSARGGAECCSRVTWMAEYLARKGVMLGTFASVPDYRTGERLTINSDTTSLSLDLPLRGRPAIIGCDSETKAGQLHWVYWDGEHVRDPNPDAPDPRPLSDFAGKVVDIYPLTFVVDWDGKLECVVKDEPTADAVKERDFEWWQALCLVDSVAPTPEAVGKWVIDVQDYHEAELRRQLAEANKERDDYDAFVQSRKAQPMFPMPNGLHVDTLHGAIGICTESGELLDAVKKCLFYGRELDRTNVIEELGDVEFYLSVVRHVMGVSRSQVIEANRRKLETRYKARFTKDEAENRDVKAEQNEIADLIGERRPSEHDQAASW